MASNRDVSRLRVLIAATLLFFAIGVALQIGRAARYERPRRSGEIEALYHSAHQTVPIVVTLLCSRAIRDLRRDPACVESDVPWSAEFVYYTLFGIEAYRVHIACGGMR